MRPGPVLAQSAPLLPDPDDARDLLRRELEDPAYDAAEPTLLDRAAKVVGDFFAQLLDPDLSGAWGPAAAVVATVVVVAVLGAALLIWGRPRSSPRSRRTGTELFGADERRSATMLRADAAAAAARGDWDAAIALRFRALARGLAERAIVEPSPGTTAQAFARAAAAAFPASAPELARAATTFDDVRYLRRPGTRALYEESARLDDVLVRTRPAAAEVVR
ncbi:DUF4129 domain-containing protein [Microbacterium lushaniae]|nr:DUF4129 domain-containing protein [Microbacterium lushaniae]